MAARHLLTRHLASLVRWFSPPAATTTTRPPQLEALPNLIELQLLDLKVERLGGELND
jgi:hypothetical protein